MADLMRYSEFMPLREAVDRLFQQAFTTFPLWTSNRFGFHVPVDLYESADRYVLRAFLPGVKPEDVQVTYQNGTLVIAGEWKPMTWEGYTPVLQEIGSGSFRREVRLPVEIDADKIEATYEHGMLLLTLPKAEAARPKAIKVQTRPSRA